MVSIGGRRLTSLCFADDTDALPEEEQELEVLSENLDKTCTRYKMEISAEKKGADKGRGCYEPSVTRKQTSQNQQQTLNNNMIYEQTKKI